MSCALAMFVASASTPDRSSVIRGCLDDSNALVEAKTLQAGDHRINMKMVECPGLTPRSPTSDLPRSVPKPKSLVARPASQCTMPDICVCGAGCTPTCHELNGFQSLESDCQQLMVALADIDPPTFFVPFTNVMAVSLGDCEFAFINEGASELEYCFEDLGQVGLQIAKPCITQNFNAAVCSQADPIFAIDWLFFTQPSSD